MIFKNIIGTAGTRILNAIISLILLLMITNFIGSKGMGQISLIVVDLTVIQLFIDWMAGSALVYFASRTALSRLLIPAYLWSLGILLLFTGLGLLTHFVYPQAMAVVIPKGFEKSVFVLAFLNAFMQIHYNLLIGQKRIRQYNFVFTLQVSGMLLFFGLFLFGMNDFSAHAYANALALAWALGGLTSFYLILKSVDRFSLRGWQSLLKAIFLYGFQTQLSNVLHIANKRLSFYVIRIYSGLSPLGVYSAGVQLTEGLRLIGQSISLVQFSAISNSRKKEYARRLTIQLMKFSVGLTFLALVILLLIPQSVYQLIFSTAFGEIKIILMALSAGVLALSANTIFSHFFSGIGQPKVNVYANAMGLIFTLLLLFILIPLWGIVGAAIAASVSYTITVIYQAIVFKRQTQTKWIEWIPKTDDFTEFVLLTKQILLTNETNEDK
jgi:O-antigen/teichoic acid export membrane protein